MKTRHLVQCSRSSFFGVTFAAFCAFGCQSADTHELGYTQSVRDLEEAPPEEPTEPFFTSHDDFVGSWIGEADAVLTFEASAGALPVYEFPSGSSRIALELDWTSDEFGGSLLAGTLTFGEAAPLPPATDPTDVYPPGTDYAALLSYGSQPLIPGSLFPNNLDSRLPPFEGFAYSATASYELLNPDLEESPGAPDGVLAISFATSEILDSWCQLQTPHPIPSGGYSIAPYAPGGTTNDDGGLCELHDLDESACPPNYQELTGDDLLAVIGCAVPGAVIGQVSCNQVAFQYHCECTEESCRSLDAVFDTALSSQLLVRRVGDGLIGAFQNEIFLNARNLTVPVGQVRFEPAAE